ncbi:cytochrome c maturation protein CcmE [Pirellulales bacterium]|nr:cytochrome c maturation protein CcmE [Pirellulales bacterium]
MTPVHRLCAGGIVITLATAYLAYLGASSSWQFYVSVDELMADAKSFRDSRIRVSGRVAPDSLRVAPDRSQGAFVLLGANSKLAVKVTGPIPDNLAEGIDVVVEGRVQSAGIVQGNRVLTRCASKYSSSP